jgi:hypothetical protein
MGAVLRDTTLYTNYETNKYVADARDRYGRVVPVYFSVTIVSAATVADTYNLFTLLANWAVCGLNCSTNGLGGSAGAGVTFQIGDSGDDDRYMAATDFDAANALGHLAYAGQNYRPTSNTIIVAKIGGAAGVVGQIVKGHFFLIPGS